jgi:hypothetical protein
LCGLLAAESWIPAGNAPFKVTYSRLSRACFGK